MSGLILKFTSTEFRLYFTNKIEMTINLKTSADHVNYWSVKGGFLKYEKM